MCVRRVLRYCKCVKMNVKENRYRSHCGAVLLTMFAGHAHSAKVPYISAGAYWCNVVPRVRCTQQVWIAFHIEFPEQETSHVQPRADYPTNNLIHQGIQRHGKMTTNYHSINKILIISATQRQIKYPIQLINVVHCKNEADPKRSSQ